MALNRFQHFVFALLTIAVSISVTLLIAELAVRLFVPRPQWEFRESTEDWAVDPELGWVQKSNLDSTLYKGEFRWTVRFQTNPDGLQPVNALRDKSPGTLRVMIFGDSTAVGRLVPEEARIHRQLEKLLHRKAEHVEVINAGVEGYSTDQELLSMKRLVPLYHPDIVLLDVCDNDFDANTLKTAYGISKPLYVVTNGQITQYEAPDPQFLEIKAFHAGIAGRMVRRSALYRLFIPQIFLLRSRFFDLTTEKAAVLTVGDYYYNPPSVAHIPLNVFEALVGEMKTTCTRNGAVLYAYAHPAAGEVWDPYIRATEKRLNLKPGVYNRYAIEAPLKQIMARRAVTFCPLIDYFRQNQSRGPFHLLPRDPHCNPAGYQLTAEALAECIHIEPAHASTARMAPPEFNSLNVITH